MHRRRCVVGEPLLQVWGFIVWMDEVEDVGWVHALGGEREVRRLAKGISYFY